MTHHSVSPRGPVPTPQRFRPGRREGTAAESSEGMCMKAPVCPCPQLHLCARSFYRGVCITVRVHASFRVRVCVSGCSCAPVCLTLCVWKRLCPFPACGNVAETRMSLLVLTAPGVPSPGQPLRPSLPSAPSCEPRGTGPAQPPSAGPRGDAWGVRTHRVSGCSRYPTWAFLSLGTLPGTQRGR